MTNAQHMLWMLMNTKQFKEINSDLSTGKPVGVTSSSEEPKLQVTALYSPSAKL
jgi:hypothetical protein